MPFGEVDIGPGLVNVRLNVFSVLTAEAPEVEASIRKTGVVIFIFNGKSVDIDDVVASKLCGRRKGWKLVEGELQTGSRLPMDGLLYTCNNLPVPTA